MKNCLELSRPHQWLKNLLLLFPPFLAGSVLRLDPLAGLLPLIGFSAGASCIYVVNDLFDIDRDRRHPRKKHRPLAAGRVAPAAAIVLALLLAVCALLVGAWVSPHFLFVLLVYMLVSLAYSWKLKNLPLVELFCVVSGFLLRLFAGGIAYSVDISDWLFLSVFLLALFLVCGKRLSELRHEGAGAPALVRPVLEKYPRGFLEGGMFVSGAAVLVTYTMYVISHNNSIWLIPLCCFGLLAYLLRVLSGRGGDPTRALLKDPLLLLVGIAWVLMVAWPLYGASL